MATIQSSTDPARAIAARDILPFVGRLLMAVLFLVSGTGKLSAPDATIAFIASVGLPFPTLGLLIALAVELGCATALVLGYRTRIMAGVLAAFCFATAVFFHMHFGDQNQFIHFFKNVTMAGGFLQIVAFGAGKLSIDARRP
ncbi:DoxX family protein [Sphingomonas sp. OTU376]|uniref:DoxX family protein n=1 Tax=Sphingomonas sp. OTU376 TaxID=3043863 RepID=UPI00313AF67E